MKLSRTIVYGIHAIEQLARAHPGVPIPCSQLARQGQLPERFLVQILRSLVTHGLLQSTCGVAGGYFLSRSPEQITLREIVEVFDNPLEVKLPELGCMSQEVRIRIMDTLHSTAQAARAELHKLTVADLLRPDANRPEVVYPNGQSPAEIAIVPLERNDYDSRPGDSPVIR